MTELARRSHLPISSVSYLLLLKFTIIYKYNSASTESYTKPVDWLPVTIYILSLAILLCKRRNSFSQSRPCRYCYRVDRHCDRKRRTYHPGGTYTCLFSQGETLHLQEAQFPHLTWNFCWNVGHMRLIIHFCPKET